MQTAQTNSGHVVFTLGGPESSFKCPRLTGGNCNCTAYCGEYCRAKAEPAKTDASVTADLDELKLKATHYDWLLNEARKTGVSVRFVNGGKDMCVGGIIDESIFDGLVSALKRMLDAFHEDPFENNTSGAVEEAYEALEKAGAK